jgi:hypothetical protein
MVLLFIIHVERASDLNQLGTTAHVSHTPRSSNTSLHMLCSRVRETDLPTIRPRGAQQVPGRGIGGYRMGQNGDK